MQALEKIPGEDFRKTEISETYLKPSKHPGRSEIRHNAYVEPAVAAWREMDAARKKAPADLGIEWTPNPRGACAVSAKGE